MQQNQQTLKSVIHRRICEDFTTADIPDDIRSGRKVILPLSFTGSLRYLHQHVQNAIAIAREYHTPDLFITFTCNHQWTKNTHSHIPNQQPYNRLYFEARVINQQQKELMNDLINGNVMGRRVDVVEFQKRELLHSHIPFILRKQDRQHTVQEVDQVIDATPSQYPDTFPNGPKREQCRLLGQFVVTHMAHNCTKLSRQHGSQCKKGYKKPTQRLPTRMTMPSIPFTNKDLQGKR